MSQPHQTGEASSRIASVEIARAAISALCYASADRSREAHTISIKSAFERAGDPGGYRYGLSALSLVREIQQLPRGFWIPTPVRAVELGEFSLVVASVPTHRLEYEIPGAKRAGVSRIVPSAQCSHLERQDFSSWVGHTPTDPRLSTLNELSKLVAELRPTVQNARLEYFRVDVGRHGYGGAPRFRWHTEPGNPLPIDDSAFLCREQRGQSGYRFCLVRRRSGKVQEEAPVSGRPTRLQFGIALVEGKPIQIDYAIREATVELIIPESLPKAEYRFIEAIGIQVHKHFGARTYALPRALQSSAVDMLTGLGCIQGKSHV